MIKDRRRNFRIGGSYGFTFPPRLELGAESTMAADRLLLIDPMGEIDESDLLEFLTHHVEPAFYRWRRTRRSVRGRVGAAARDISQGAAQATAPSVSVVPVQCWACLGTINWRLDLGPVGFCPACGALIHLPAPG